MKYYFSKIKKHLKKNNLNKSYKKKKIKND